MACFFGKYTFVPCNIGLVVMNRVCPNCKKDSSFTTLHQKSVKKIVFRLLSCDSCKGDLYTREQPAVSGKVIEDAKHALRGSKKHMGDKYKSRLSSVALRFEFYCITIGELSSIMLKPKSQIKRVLNGIEVNEDILTDLEKYIRKR